MCFFHPFADGNARSAMLAFALVPAKNNLVLAKHAIVLDEVGPVAQVQHPADDLAGAAGFTHVGVILTEGTQRHFTQDRRPATSLR
ncbi:hypothetical protein [Actinomadura decatromicini]|uniref:hypothetical protein n=1 Tax=Actinomadura decatromicini TaxID=2604572 RepID=UPI001CA3163A